MAQHTSTESVVAGLADWGAPVFEELGLSVYDIEINSGRLVVTVDKPGGVGLDEIARCTRGLSPILDERDPIAGTYTLEVSSPGLERRLRTVDHRRAAVGETVKCKYRDAQGAAHRVEGTLSDVDDDVLVVETPTGPVRVPHEDVTTVRTVFVWPVPAKGGADRHGAAPKTAGSPETKKSRTAPEPKTPAPETPVTDGNVKEAKP